MNSEIKLSVSELKEALPGLSKVVGKGRSLPVLQSIRINRTRDGVVQLQATDLDTFVTYTAKEAQAGPVEELLVPLEQLNKAVKSSTAKQEIAVATEAKDRIKLRYSIAGNQVEQTIGSFSPQEFPEAPKVDKITIPLDPGFGVALREALECSSEDSSRYILTGACLDVTDEKFHYVVATNGRMLFSANSFCFDLDKSVLIPDSRFLRWADFLEDQPLSMSVEPGEDPQPAEKGHPAKQGKPGYVKLDSQQWSFVTRQLEGKFPNWKQVVPATDATWTRITLSKEAITHMLQVIPKLPGDETANSTIRLTANGVFEVAGQGEGAKEWSSIPVTNVTITGKPVSICLNRRYVLQALRYGMDQIEILDSITAALLSNGRKKMVMMPVSVSSEPKAPQETAPKPQQQPEPTQPSMKTEERNDSIQTNRNDASEEVSFNTRQEPPPSAIKSLIEQVDHIKESLRSAIRDLTAVIDIVKQAEKEKRASEKEIEAIRTKLRQIQSVSI